MTAPQRAESVLTEEQREAIERALCTLGKVECQVLGHDHSRHLNRLIPAVEHIVAAHVDAALSEVERRIEAERQVCWDAHGHNCIGGSGYTAALDMIADYRQEQD